MLSRFADVLAALNDHEDLTTRLPDFRVDIARGRRLRAAVSRGWESLPIAARGGGDA